MPKHLPERVLTNLKSSVDYDEIYPLDEIVAQAEKEAIINALNKTKEIKLKG